MNTTYRLMGSTVTALVISSMCMAQANQANYDESKVPEYSLPELLVCEDGDVIETAESWTSKRRPELVRLFESQMYGRVPAMKVEARYEVFDVADDALGGKAIRKQVSIFLSDQPDAPRLDLLMYLPRDQAKPVPVFIGLNFNGNHSIQSDPAIRLSRAWMRDSERNANVEHRATEESRGTSSSRWPVEAILARGYGVATIYCGDIDTDYDDGFRNGVHALVHREGTPGPAADEWGTIAAWAWGLSRGLDYLIADPDVDGERVAVMGHSRLGKTALWAGAMDERFAVVISNNSGCGGAALSRREYGETVRRINTSFPHWFCDNFLQYNERVDELPIDQHGLIALMAPRPVLVCSAEEDRWADPRGEFLSCVYADPVYRLLGRDGIRVDADVMPPLDTLVGDTIGYHIRPGAHDVLPSDWQVYCDFADRFLRP